MYYRIYAYREYTHKFLAAYMHMVYTYIHSLIIATLIMLWSILLRLELRIVRQKMRCQQ